MGDTTKHWITSDKLISYGNYVFEFKQKERRGMHSQATASLPFDYDTVGVYLVSTQNKFFFEFDTFALTGNIVRAGRLIDKDDGMNFSKMNAATLKFSSSYKPIDIIDNKIPYSYIDTLSSRRIGDFYIDSFRIRTLLIKKKNFTSMYDVYGVTPSFKKYSIVAFSFYLLKRPVSYFNDIGMLRPLTKKEEDICAAMVQKSKYSITDTIKARPLIDFPARKL